ncbi:aminotransferase class V-fold PLP-dependent enzyme [Enterobacteriaceae bacterium RIT691]|nr:aminotransferase class V-fold PLP-dependent enzyme [Enterobacteriaceae bacterium RIT691]
MNNSELAKALNLTPVINVSGTMTYLGASIVVPQAIEAMTKILPEFVKMEELQRFASRTIARLTGSEAGFITASCASGISLAIAGCMTKDNLLAVEALPETAAPYDVVIQAGHNVSYGAAVDQAVRLTGARCVQAGQATQCQPYHLEQSINENTVAALYVVSHHVVEYGQLPLSLFCEIAHARGVPVIVDAASEYDLRRFLADGADIVLYSGHKFLGGPTSGIVAGKKELVRYAWLQNRGIGRGMKVGKESVYGAIAALEAWETRDHQRVRDNETRILDLWVAGLANIPGVQAAREADPTDNPLERCKITLDPTLTRTTAWDLAQTLAAGKPSIIVRDHLAEKGYFYLDPCNLHPGQEEVVLARLREALAAAREAPTAKKTAFAEILKQRQQAILRWPD